MRLAGSQIGSGADRTQADPTGGFGNQYVQAKLSEPVTLKLVLRAYDHPMRFLALCCVLIIAGCNAGPGSLPNYGYDVYLFGFERGTATNFGGESAGSPAALELGTLLADAGWLSFDRLGTDPQTEVTHTTLEGGPASSSWVSLGLQEFLDTHAATELPQPPPWRGTVTVEGDVATVRLALTLPETQAARLTGVEMAGTLSKSAVDAAVASVASVGYAEQLESAPIDSHWLLIGSLDGNAFELSFNQTLTCWSSHGHSNDPHTD